MRDGDGQPVEQRGRVAVRKTDIARRNTESPVWVSRQSMWKSDIGNIVYGILPHSTIMICGGRLNCRVLMYENPLNALDVVKIVQEMESAGYFLWSTSDAKIPKKIGLNFTHDKSYLAELKKHNPRISSWIRHYLLPDPIEAMMEATWWMMFDDPLMAIDIT